MILYSLKSLDHDKVKQQMALDLVEWISKSKFIVFRRSPILSEWDDHDKELHWYAYSFRAQAFDGQGNKVEPNFEIQEEGEFIRTLEE